MPSEAQEESQPLLDVRIAELGSAVLDETIIERDEPWVYDLGEVDGHEIVIATNTDEENLVDPEGCMEVDFAPFQMGLWDNGWLAYRGPGGQRHLGPEAAEHRWIDALEDEIEEHGGDISPEGSDA